MDCVLINNMEGAYQATHFLIKKRQTQPGYIKSTYRIHNFEERMDGYIKALQENGMSPHQSIIHEVSPSLEGSYADMISILDSGTKLADCYFVDHDLIAAGTIRAFKEKGYKIPEDIAIVGFDNIPLCTYIEPQLTTVNVPISYMARMAVNRLIEVIEAPSYMPIKIEVGTNLIKRDSV